MNDCPRHDWGRGRESGAVADEASIQKQREVRKGSMCRAVWDGGEGVGGVLACYRAAGDRCSSNARFDTGQHGIAGMTVVGVESIVKLRKLRRRSRDRPRRDAFADEEC